MRSRNLIAFSRRASPQRRTRIPPRKMGKPGNSPPWIGSQLLQIPQIPQIPRQEKRGGRWRLSHQIPSSPCGGIMLASRLKGRTHTSSEASFQSARHCWGGESGFRGETTGGIRISSSFWPANRGIESQARLSWRQAWPGGCCRPTHFFQAVSRRKQCSMNTKPARISFM